MSATVLEVRDIVRLGNGSRIIITGFNPTRPANKYRGVLENGQGKEYIFGEKHRPVFVGVAPENHPALVAMGFRAVDHAGAVAASAGVDILDSAKKAIIKNLVLTAERVLTNLEAGGVDTGLGGPLSDMRDAVSAVRNLLA